MKCLSAFPFHLNMAISSTLEFVLWIGLILSCVGKVESIGCGFENGDVCGWTNDNFTVYKYKSPLQNSGPDKAFEKDYYAYFYGSSAESPGAFLQFSLSKSDGDCLFMAYHMWGSQMGSLSVYVIEGEKVSVTAFSGDQGNKWHCIGIDLLLQGPSTVTIQAIRGTGLLSIIGIDDIRVFHSQGIPCNKYNCTLTPAKDDITTQTSLSPSTSLPIDITTNTRVTTTQSFFTENLPLIAGVPGGLVVFVIIAGILIVVCRRNKEKEEDKFPEMVLQGQQAIINRYRSLPNNRLHPDEEVYDEIKEGPEYSYADTREVLDNKGYLKNESVSNDYLHPISDGYLTPQSVNDMGQNGDPYLKPLSRQDKNTGNRDENYTILPAITLPIDKVNAGYTKKLASSTMSNDYVEAKNLNIPHKPGKKISISDQGDVMYFDISKNMSHKNVDSENGIYLSLSQMK
ncbi:uncharacterized protein LOC125664112 [Ostrea edulis]|uniref:uncharacterized protein LOC125664112 n=1 Tax=Ostrea edulis TaxID=37623 RepID=UPI0024AFC684|nr:uncharacterized protein LOC125664112 [Ostrea edulis]